MRRLCLLVLASLAFLPYRAAALADPPPLVTDRPDFTESASAVPRGGVQLEGGTTVARSGDADAVTVGELLLRVGLLAGWELRLGIPSYTDLSLPGPGDVAGLEDATLGAKVEIAHGGGTASPRPDVALLLGSTLPTGDGALGEERFQPEVKIALGWALSQRWDLGANLGYGRAAEDGVGFDQGSWSVAVGHPWGERLGSFLELFGFSRETPGGAAAHYLDAGITWLLTPSLQLDLRVGAGLDDGAATDHFAGAGFAARW